MNSPSEVEFHYHLSIILVQQVSLYSSRFYSVFRISGDRVLNRQSIFPNTSSLPDRDFGALLELITVGAHLGRHSTV